MNGEGVCRCMNDSFFFGEGSVRERREERCDMTIGSESENTDVRRISFAEYLERSLICCDAGMERKRSLRENEIFFRYLCVLQECFADHALRAIGIICRDIALVDKEEVNVFPWQLCSSQRFVQVSRS